MDRAALLLLRLKASLRAQLSSACEAAKHKALHALRTSNASTTTERLSAATTRNPTTPKWKTKLLKIHGKHWTFIFFLLLLIWKRLVRIKVLRKNTWWNAAAHGFLFVICDLNQRSLVKLNIRSWNCHLYIFIFQLTKMAWIYSLDPIGFSKPFCWKIP